VDGSDGEPLPLTVHVNDGIVFRHGDTDSRIDVPCASCGAPVGPGDVDVWPAPMHAECEQIAGDGDAYEAPDGSVSDEPIMHPLRVTGTNAAE
jgi:hypothetical protein